MSALTQRLDAYAPTELRSPVNGIVKNVCLTTVGGVLKPGDEILEIVPTGEELIVESKVSHQDAAFIRSAPTHWANGDRMSPRISIYRVHLSLDTRSMHPVNRDERIEIQPGMTVSAEIKIGRNKIFQYLIKPIAKTLFDPMSER